MSGVPPTRVLVADDDEDLRVVLSTSLRHHGYDVTAVADGVQALVAARRGDHDIALLDVVMPGLDGLTATRSLRADPRTSDLPIILVTARARGRDKVDGLGQGADDYITKPFDDEELVARIEAALRRSALMRQVSPLTGLPGNSRIEGELERRLLVGSPFWLLYCDLNRFKAYNDAYGFLEGDRVLRTFAEVLVATVVEETPTDGFVGHVGGDDFVVVTGHERAEQLAAAVCARFDAAVPDFYDDDARARGWIEVEDRRGELSRVGHVSVDIGIARAVPDRIAHVGELVARATEMKHVAKLGADGASTYVVDRRAVGDRAGVDA